MDTPGNVRKYWAFISYSHSDKEWADWLHRSLENYPMPRDLVGRPTPADAPVPKRFVPVFRDREELPTATDLGAVIARALQHARFLVVICSPRSARSPWVEKEIIEYKRMHGESRVLCLIVDGEPWASAGKPGFSESDECFPRAVRFRLGKDGGISSEATEPIAADAREGKDGRENAVIKLMAGLLGVGFDDLRRREQEYQRRRLRRFQATAAVFALLFAAAVSMAIYAVRQKRTALDTLSQSDLNLAVAARNQGDKTRHMAYLARSLRSAPANPLARMAAYSSLVHQDIHPPVGPALRHPSAVLAACGSADGKWILTSCDDTLHLWSRPDNRKAAERRLNDGNIISLTELPSGDGWLAGTQNGGLHFIRQKDLGPLRPPAGFRGAPVQVLRWNPGKTILAAGLGAEPEEKHGSLLLLDSEYHELSRQATPNLSTLDLAWSRDGRRVAAAGHSPTFYLCDAGSPATPIRKLEGKLCITTLFFTPQGDLRTIDLATGMLTWNADTGTPMDKPASVVPLPTRCTFSPDGRHFIGVRRDTLAHVYDTRDAEVRTAPVPLAFTASGCVCLDDRHVLLTSESSVAQVRLIRGDAPIGELLPFDPGYPDLSAVSSDGRFLAAACSSDSIVRIYDLATTRPAARAVRFPTNLHGLCFSGSDRFLTAIGWDGKVHRVEWRKGLHIDSGKHEVTPPIDSMFDTLGGLRFQPGGRAAAIPTPQGVKIIDLDRAEVAREIPVRGGANAVGWSPDGTKVAVASRDQVLGILAADGSRVDSGVHTRLPAPVVDLVWSPDSTQLAALGNADNVDCFSALTGLPVGTAFPAGKGCSRIQWVSGGRWILASDMNEVSRLWDPETGTAVARLPDGGCDGMNLHDVPSRQAVLLSGKNGLLLVPVPEIRGIPEWLPDFLETTGGGSLGKDGKRPLMDPDEWIRSEREAKGSKRDPLWTPVAEWLCNRNPVRPVFPGSAVSSTDSGATLDSAKQAAFDQLVSKADKLWKSGEDGDRNEAISRMDQALALKPHNLRLLRVKQRIAGQLGRPAMLREACSAMASSPDAPLRDVLDAKLLEAASWLTDQPTDPAAARRLLQEILAEDPGQPEAKKMLEEIPR